MPVFKLGERHGFQLGCAEAEMTADRANQGFVI
jgi:hypothetical protein